MQESSGSATLEPPISAAPPSAFRRFAPTVATAAVVALCVTAGQWQRARMQYKQGLQARYQAAAAAAALQARDLPAAADWPALRYRQVELEGAFDARSQILLDNKVQAGRAGYDVIAPLVLVDGRVLLVDRGWVPVGPTRDALPRVPAPAGIVTVHGRIELPPRRFELAEPANEARSAHGPRSQAVVWQNLDFVRYAAFSGRQVAPALVLQTAPAALGDDLVRSWPAPDFGIDTHRIYMVQWYAFALLAFVFWAVAHWRGWRHPRP